MEREAFTQFEVPSHGEKLIRPEPGLRYITKALKLLEPEKDRRGKMLRWQELSEEVGPWENMLELSDNVRETVRGFIAGKISTLKERAPSLKGLSDKDLLDALTHNWFEGVDEDIEGQRRKVLLAVMAHVVKRIETTAYKKVFEQAQESDLQKLGLDGALRDLAIDVMEASLKSDPLFVRFLAYAQLSKRSPKEATPATLYLPDDPSPHTMAELFPYETQFIAKKFADIAAHSEVWQDRPGGKEFKEYIEKLAAFYREADPQQAQQLQDEIEEQYNRVVTSDFPILVTTGFEGEMKPPYNDPELRVSVKTADAAAEQKDFERMRDAMAESLSKLGVGQFANTLKDQQVRIVNVIGNYGVNLTFSAVSQEDPTVLFLNEQIRTYDREFPGFMRDTIKNTKAVFANLSPEAREARMQKMSRASSLFHEYSHEIYSDESPEAKRLGVEGLETITDAKAEIVYRALLPNLVEHGALEGTGEQWACAALASSLQILKDQPEDDDYYRAAVYALNGLLKEGAVVFDGKRLEIKKFETYWRIQEDAARRVLALYQDGNMTEGRADAWVEKYCKPSTALRQVSKFLKSRGA